MSVPGFLFLIFGCLGVLGVILARLGYWRVYWGLMVGITVLLAVSVAMTWRPSTDDPYPALMMLVIGVYGSGASVAGLLTGLMVSRLIAAKGANN